MVIQRGFRDKIEKYFNPNEDITVEVKISGGSVYDFCCFGVDENNKLSDDRYMVFFNQHSSPGNEINYTPINNGASFKVSLYSLPQTINKLVFTANIDGNGNMGQINSFDINLSQNGNTVMSFSLPGSEFYNEKAIIGAEIYKKDIWRIAFVASGFNGGLSDLLKSFGGEEISEKNTPAPAPTPVINQQRTMQPIPPKPVVPDTPKPAENIPKKVELRKGQKINLAKKGSELGEVIINLNWNQRQKKSFFFGNTSIDLDLGCLFELKNGAKGCIQALGRTFGSYSQLPYIMLDGDDRTGAVAGGENIRINGRHISEIKRILVYTFIYEGAANWKEADGVVTIKCPGSQEVVVRMDEYGSLQKMCVIALLENVNDDTFCIEKLIQFCNGHREMDRMFNWGLRWSYGTK